MNADAANGEEQVVVWKGCKRGINYLYEFRMIMKRLDGRAKNRGFLQPPITRENVLFVALEQCKDCLGISPVSAQGRKGCIASLKWNTAFRRMPTERKVVRSCGTDARNCIRCIGDPW